MDASIIKITLHTLNAMIIYRMSSDRVYRSDCRETGASLSTLSYTDFVSDLNVSIRKASQCIFKYRDGHKEILQVPLEINSNNP